MAEFADPGPDPDFGPDSDPDQSLEDTLAIEEEAACHAFEVRMCRPHKLRCALSYEPANGGLLVGITECQGMAQKGRAAVSGFCRKKSSLKRLDMQGDGEM